MIRRETVEKRLGELRSRMEEKGIEVALFWDPDNEFYLSGFRAISYSRPIVYIVYKDKTQYILPELEKDHAKQSRAADEWLIYHEIASHAGKELDYWQLLQRVLKSLPKSSVLGVEIDIIPASVYGRLVSEGFCVRDIGQEVMEMRAIKDQEEIRWLRHAGRLSDLAMEASFANVRPGMSELEFDSYGDQRLLQVASEYYPNMIIGYEDWTCSGVQRSAMPHLHSSTRKFEKNDVVVHSRQVWINNYRAENERTFLIGTPTETQKTCLALAIKAQQTAMEMVKPGVRAKDVDLAAFRIFEEAGYGRYVQHRTGHGLGLTEHEEPYLRFDNDLVLKEGMCYTIEPGIYVPGVGGFRHSDTVIVTKDGYECLTNYPRSLEKMRHQR
ncbi:M24 family metallopeptidase [Bacillus thermotolerans]|uniref:M24 family metallopeptidase n=1 Tax=Bacillus thermotolerans TaxID=1221996 RepID=UPI000582F3B2|nr:Xaa-Pro peptidase family protein [Bacillus thermotolerans]KKB35482.1 cobalt dependent X-Pro dipeptidase [Bacillus thermotolerans]